MPGPRPPFDILRACFWLLAVVVGFALVGLLASAGTCVWGVLAGRFEPGTCVKLGIPEILRDWWSEILTAVLALLVARGGGPPAPPPPPTAEEK